MTGAASDTSTDTDASVAPIGWGRAAASGLIVLAVGAGLFVYGPNWVLIHLTGLSRGGRVAIATVGFFAALAATAWLLGRLQRRRVV